LGFYPVLSLAVFFAKNLLLQLLVEMLKSFIFSGGEKI